MLFLTILVFIPVINSTLTDKEKREFCEGLTCDDRVDFKVCGVRYEGEHLVVKVFDNECVLLQYGCKVDDDKAYGIINMKYCTEPSLQNLNDICDICPHRAKLDPVCGMRKDGEGFRMRLFPNECQLTKYNCEKNLTFEVTDFYICNDLTLEATDGIGYKTIHNDFVKADNLNNVSKEEVLKSNNHGIKSGQDPNKMNSNMVRVNLTILTKNNTVHKDFTETDLHMAMEKRKSVRKNEIKQDQEDVELNEIENIVVVDGTMLDKDNINASIDTFFAATHLVDLPLKRVELPLNVSSRRKHVKIFSPLKVYRPYVVIPKNISEDQYHEPTLGSCFHKCPTKCPDTYAPVCGKPGIHPREPSIMFQNHCFMDKAQCKMYWEAKSPTALSAYYIESAFVFCLGDELYGNYRFLPLVRTLQHMGRLKKKSSYHYWVKNMRFLNNMLKREPKLMG